MIVALLVIMVGVIVGMDTIAAPLFRDTPAGSPPIFPLLFITIACGAVSGFHSLVASGTTSKQIDKETDARYVGYLSSLGEGTLALCSILACTAGVMVYSANTGVEWGTLYVDWEAASADPQGMFIQGVAGFASNIGVPESTALVFGALVIVSFAVTTLDTAVRLKRYIIQEIATIAAERFSSGSAPHRAMSFLARNITVATLIAVLIPLALTLVPGDFAVGTLWLLFGTTNQLTAGLALSVIAVWVTKRHRNPVMILIPLVFLVVMTVWALVIQLRDFAVSGDAMQTFLLAPLDGVILLLALWMMVEAAIALNKARKSPPVAGTATEETTAGRDEGEVR